MKRSDWPSSRRSTPLATTGMPPANMGPIGRQRSALRSLCVRSRSLRAVRSRPRRARRRSDRTGSDRTGSRGLRLESRPGEGRGRGILPLRGSRSGRPAGPRRSGCEGRGLRDARAAAGRRRLGYGRAATERRAVRFLLLVSGKVAGAGRKVAPARVRQAVTAEAFGMSGGREYERGSCE